MVRKGNCVKECGGEEKNYTEFTEKRGRENPREKPQGSRNRPALQERGYCGCWGGIVVVEVDGSVVAGGGVVDEDWVDFLVGT